MDDDPLPVSEWLPAFARWVDAPVPPRMSVADALAVAGEEAVFYHMNLTGASNARAKAKLGFTPRRLLWANSARRSEEHTSELQSLMRISYAVFCLKKKKLILKRHKTSLSNIYKYITNSA